jgi:hypothetical protein
MPRAQIALGYIPPVTRSAPSGDGEAGEQDTPTGSEVETQRESPELLGRVAERLRELERAANGAVAELRREALEATEPAVTRGAGREGAAVLYELILTLSERADGLEREAELIAGILERARNAILHPERPRTLHSEPITGRATETPRKTSPPARRKAKTPRRQAQAANASKKGEAGGPRAQIGRPVSDGVKLLAAQMALNGESHDEIQLRLRSEFGVTDSATAVREVLEGEPGT